MTSQTRRLQLIERLADLIVGQDSSHPLRVAIDGVDAAGKTRLADELVEPILRRNRPVIRASIDGFHNPREIRYRRGKNSPEGYYYDSFDYEAIQLFLLSPLGPDGDRRYKTAKFDFRTESSVTPALNTAEHDSVLLFDGVFLLRPELLSSWDFSVFVDIDFKVSMERALVRDQALFGTEENVRQRYSQRYIPGQKIYLEEAQPAVRADIVVENNSPLNPILRVRAPNGKG